MGSQATKVRKGDQDAGLAESRPKAVTRPDVTEPL